jgi:hypothetical protein
MECLYLKSESDCGSVINTIACSIIPQMRHIDRHLNNFCIISTSWRSLRGVKRSSDHPDVGEVWTAVYFHTVNSSIARLAIFQVALNQQFARGFQNSVCVWFHLKMIQIASRSHKKSRQKCVRDMEQGEAQPIKT